MESLLVFAPAEYQRIALWVLMASAFVVLGIACYRLEPRYLERAMARKKERQEVGRILSDALEDARRSETISLKVEQKYRRLIGKTLGLPDMVPMSPTARFWFSYKKPDLSKAKALCIGRLSSMGVNIEQGLRRIRNGRDKKAELMSKIKFKS